MTSLEIVQRVTYHAKGKTKSADKIVAQKMFARCSAKQSIEFTNEKIQIPPLPPSEVAHCKIIDIHYFAQVSILNIYFFNITFVHFHVIPAYGTYPHLCHQSQSTSTNCDWDRSFECPSAVCKYCPIAA